MSGSDPILSPLCSIVGSLMSLCTQLLSLCFLLTVLSIFLLIIILIYLYLLASFKGRSSPKDASKSLTVGFFHPYCNAGGGGERVLWVALRAMHRRYPQAKFYIYTGDKDAAPDQILELAEKRFNVGLEGDPLKDYVEFVYLHRRVWVEAWKYPVFTLLGQSLGSVYLGCEALQHPVPDLFIDTMGYAFTLPLFKYIGGCKTGCYVHYPTISTDMIHSVRTRRPGFNNRRLIANSPLASWAKLLYYKLFAYTYGLAGRCSDVTMVNSSWTEEHIEQLWRCPNLQKVYPPCDIKEFKEIVREPDTVTGPQQIISLGQFRPEKDHPLQIRALAKVRDAIFNDSTKSEEEKDQVWEQIRLVLIGGCRNADDESRVQDLKDLCKHLAVDSNVEFKTNLSFEDLKKEMGKGLIGLHTMWNEHFGIAVVEMLASGLITLAHRTGGPLMDIVIETEANRNGFLAISEDEYSDTILHIIGMTKEAREGVRERAKSSVERFSEREFDVGWLRAIEALVNAVGN